MSWMHNSNRWMVRAMSLKMVNTNSSSSNSSLWCRVSNRLMCLGNNNSKMALCHKTLKDWSSKWYLQSICIIKTTNNSSKECYIWTKWTSFQAICRPASSNLGPFKSLMSKFSSNSRSSLVRLIKSQKKSCKPNKKSINIKCNRVRLTSSCRRYRCRLVRWRRGPRLRSLSSSSSSKSASHSNPWTSKIFNSRRQPVKRWEWELEVVVRWRWKTNNNSSSNSNNNNSSSSSNRTPNKQPQTMAMANSNSRCNLETCRINSNNRCDQIYMGCVFQ